MAGRDLANEISILPRALSGAGRRTVPAADIEELLRLCGWALAPVSDGAAAAHDALAGLIANGLPFAETAAGRRYDPAEVVNFIKQAQGGAGDLWQRYVGTGRALLAESIGLADKAAPDFAALPPLRFEVEIRRSFDLSGVGTDGRLRLRLPLPVASARLRLLSVTPILPEGVQHVAAPGRIEVRMRHPGTARIDLAVRMLFVADPAGPDTAGTTEPIWLARDAGPIPVTAAVQALASDVAGSIGDPLDAVLALHDYLIDGFRCGVMPYDRLPAASVGEWILDCGWYDCRLAAALLVALCRARGIPARLVGGYLLWRVPTEHYWAEVVIDGVWRPFDMLGWDLSAGGTDAAWRRTFAGATDYRLTTQILPDIFTGAPGIPLPTSWHRLTSLTEGGAETRLITVPDGRVVLAEEVIVRADPSEEEGEAVRPLDPQAGR
jgi:transglutaminase-like putative cysteine protease